MFVEIRDMSDTVIRGLSISLRRLCTYLLFATREIGSAPDLWVHVGTIVSGETFRIMSRTRARFRREQPCDSSLKPSGRLVPAMVHRELRCRNGSPHLW